ncbi:protein of unknown function [Thermosyntropha lipolytica DSM 11003]|uniref:DUF4911 domain-containing protein n=1 Tax=Thermosyntropha lipolytica DSM 11003 TaxID=1123382 RepID=A0A1M5MVR3_9FIRM|nr:DUF4911 domain-containing protein [Thermosyntropha lipolytica]SHG81371.1 protein of unknown function [Thermosyntropha lipolytica DSM 11003]
MLKGDIYAKIAPENIDRITRIIEAYENVGIVSTADRKNGLVIIRGTADTYEELKRILLNMPFRVEIVEEK